VGTAEGKAMTPSEIKQLKQQSPFLQEMLKDQRIWQFLRTCILQQSVSLSCTRCAKDTPHIETADYLPDLCVDCLLREYLSGELSAIDDIHRDPRSRYYDAEYDAQCKMWDDPDDDYDGTGLDIVMASGQ